jgi:type IV secretory pathway VirB10-like protein
MRAGKHLVILIALAMLVGGVACKKKKPDLPPQAQPPTITQPQPETPPAEPQPEQIPPATTPPATETAPEPAPPAPKPKPHKRKKPASTASTPGTESASKPGAAKPATSGKTIVDNTKPTDSNVQISAEVPPGVANQRKQQTEDLLNVAEANMKKINRSLTDGEQSMQRQVRNFITQSRLAIQDGDFERAYNLATKAQQLSQELVK